MELKEIEPSLNEIDGKVQKLWENVIGKCTQVLHHARIYGFNFMTLPDPNVHDFARHLEVMVIPMLNRLAKEGEFSPESGIKIASIRQYVGHLKDIVKAIDQENQEMFDKYVLLLMRESMLS